MAVLSEVCIPQREYFSIKLPQGIPWVFQWDGFELSVVESPEEADIC